MKKNRYFQKRKEKWKILKIKNQFTIMTNNFKNLIIIL